MVLFVLASCKFKNMNFQKYFSETHNMSLVDVTTM